MSDRDNGVTYIGFETQEVLIKDNMSKVDVTLRESSASVIDEVVITGTGAQKKITMVRAKLSASGNVYGNDFPTERRPLYRYQ